MELLRFRASIPSVLALPRSLATALLLAGASASAGAPAQDLAAQARKGREAMAAGRFDEAARVYAEIVEALPDQPGMRMNLGMALSMSGRPAEALPHLEKAVKLQPELLPAWLFLGTTHLELGQPARAVEPLQKFLTAQPDNADVRSRLAEALLALERYPAAAREFRRICEQAPRSSQAWYGLGRSYEGVVRGVMQELQRTAPDSPELTLLIADAMTASGRDADALRLYREVLEKRPGQAEVHEVVARIYARRDHPDWAEIERARAQSLPPPDCTARSLECDYRAGRFRSVFTDAQSRETPEARYWLARASDALAREAFSRLGQLPPSPEATLLQFDMLMAQRQPVTKGVELLRGAAEAWPEDLRVGRELARLLAVADPEAALELLERLLAADPISPELAMLQGEAWLKLLQPDKAIPSLERACALDPSLLAARAALGRAYMEGGQPAKAVPALEAALATDKDGALYYQLSRAYRELGEREKSREAVKKFQELRSAAEAEARSLREEFAITPPR